MGDLVLHLGMFNVYLCFQMPITMHYHDATDYDLIEKKIKEELKHFEKFNLHSDQHNHYTILLQKICPDRLKEDETFPKPLRAVFSYLMHHNLKAMGGEFPEYCKKRFWTGQLPFVVEVIMTILYYDNQILDQKGDVTGHKAICNNVLIGRQLQAQLGLYIQDRIPVELQAKVLTLVNEVLMVVCAGQYKERSHNFYQHWLNEEFDHYDFADWAKQQIPHHLIDDVLNLIYKVCPELVGKKEAFLTNYLGRVYLVNAFFFERITQLMLDLLVTPFEEKSKKDLIEFSQIFGIMHQLVNDTSDFVPSYRAHSQAAKNREDALRDLRNGNITLPTFIHLELYKNSNSEVNKYLAKYTEVYKAEYFPSIGYNQKIISDELCKFFSLFFAIDVTKKLGVYARRFKYKCFDYMLDVSVINKNYLYFDEQNTWKSKYKKMKREKKKRN